MGKNYIVQDCVYAVILNGDGEVAVARTPKGIVLIGGGVERGESERDALHREAYEESGYRIDIRNRVGIASQYVNNFAKGRFRLKRGVFFLCEFTERLGPPLEPDHELIWLAYDDARQQLIRPFHRWALEVGYVSEKGSS
ncbi:NUDIX domain-containing protein [Thalassospira australica]|uniref:NUDIX domain-containing protein n=1 Tax=Thalassospira australica TaxID=1528106 RepID=UPI0038507905